MDGTFFIFDILHPDKISIRKIRQGIDFVGYVILLSSTVLRTATKRRILKKIKKSSRGLRDGKADKDKFEQIISSYWGVLKHCQSFGIKRKINKIRVETTRSK